MRRIREFAFVALVSIVAFCVGSQQALAQADSANLGKGHLTLKDHYGAGVTPDAAVGVVQGPVGFVVPPPSLGPPPSWPCFSPNAPCSSDPAGGLLTGLPLQQWPISGATNCTQVPCGQVISMFETASGHGSVSFSVSITQGSTTLYSQSFSHVGTATPLQVGVVDVTGIQFAPSAVAGAATVSVTTTVGTSPSVTGKTTIYLQ